MKIGKLIKRLVDKEHEIEVIVNKIEIDETTGKVKVGLLETGISTFTKCPRRFYYTISRGKG